MEFLIFNVSYRFLMKVARHVQSTRKGILLNFSNILRKSIATASVFYCDARHLDTLLGSNHVCLTYFWVAVVKNGRGLLDHGTLKSSVPQRLKESELIK